MRDRAEAQRLRELRAVIRLQKWTRRYVAQKKFQLALKRILQIQKSNRLSIMWMWMCVCMYDYHFTCASLHRAEKVSTGAQTHSANSKSSNRFCSFFFLFTLLSMIYMWMWYHSRCFLVFVFMYLCMLISSCICPYLNFSCGVINTCTYSLTHTVSVNTYAYFFFVILYLQWRVRFWLESVRTRCVASGSHWLCRHFS